MMESNTRIAGLDLARGLAVVGMMIAHVGADDVGVISRWFWVFDGRSAALFAVLAGVGLALMTRRPWHDLRSGTPASWSPDTWRIVRRAAVLFGLGLALTHFLDTPVAVILSYYAVMFIAALPFLRLGPASLILSAALVAGIGPPLVFLARLGLTGQSDSVRTDIPILDEVLLGYYPALAWLSYILVGLAVGRALMRPEASCHLGRRRNLLAVLLTVGPILTFVGYAAGAGLGSGPATSGSVDGSSLAHEWLWALTNVEPHADSFFELTGNIGVALTVIGLSLVLTASATGQALTYPLRAVGALALTSYVLHLVIIAALTALYGALAVVYPSDQRMLALVAIPTIGVACLWYAFTPRGPLERLLRLATGTSNEPSMIGSADDGVTSGVSHDHGSSSPGGFAVDPRASSNDHERRSLDPNDGTR